MRQTALLMLVIGLLSGSTTAAQEEVGFANYAYAVFVGTGRYSLNDGTIYLIRAPLEFWLKEPDFVSKAVGYRLLATGAVGITNFDNIADIPDLNLDSLATLSFTPGIEVVVPVTANWQISPFGQVGLGWETSSSSNTLIWGIGARTRAWFGDNQQWLIGGEWLRAGNNPSESDELRSTFARYSFGAEYKWQTNWTPFDRRVSWHVRLIDRIYSPPAIFDEAQRETKLHNSTEIGVSFGISPAVNILGYSFRQLGVGYETSNDLQAVKIFTTFPF